MVHPIKFKFLTGAVEEQSQIFLKTHLFIEDTVPNGIVGIVVPVEIFQTDLFNDTGFETAGSPADPHTHFTRSIAAQNRSFVHKQSFDTMPGSGNSSAHTGETAADDAKFN